MLGQSSGPNARAGGAGKRRLRGRGEAEALGPDRGSERRRRLLPRPTLRHSLSSAIRVSAPGPADGSGVRDPRNPRDPPDPRDPRDPRDPHPRPAKAPRPAAPAPRCCARRTRTRHLRARRPGTPWPCASRPGRTAGRQAARRLTLIGLINSSCARFVCHFPLFL